jgi:hypothetical protein
VLVGGGRENVVENNIFIDTRPAVHVDARCTDPRPVWRDMTYETMKKRLEAMRHHEPPYSERYPELKQLDAYLEGATGVPPEGTRIRRNLISGAGASEGKWLDTRWRVDTAWLDLQDNVAADDLGFADPAARDFSPKDPALARSIGFEPIPIEKIGPQRGRSAARR